MYNAVLMHVLERFEQTTEIISHAISIDPWHVPFEIVMLKVWDYSCKGVLITKASQQTYYVAAAAEDVQMPQLFENTIG